MNASRMFSYYHLTWTPDRKIVVTKGSGWTGHVFILCGPGQPEFPDHPITKQEFYAMLSELAQQGYMDNLLDF
jgi:hypothetical protein